MPYGKRYKSKKKVKKARSASTKFSARPRKSKKRAAPVQTIRIVVEQPNPNPPGVPGVLPPAVGNVVAIAPRRARF